MINFVLNKWKNEGVYFDLILLDSMYLQHIFLKTKTIATILIVLEYLNLMFSLYKMIKKILF